MKRISSKLALKWEGLARPLFVAALFAFTVAAQDPLPSWNDSFSKSAIVQFVTEVTRQGGSSFVPDAQRIATFDNDGTLWVEQPLYTQFAFAVARVKTLAPKHAEWKEQQPFKAVLDGDMKTLAASGERGLVQLIMATHTGITTDEFQGIVSDWIGAARHPRFQRPFTECVYQPMLELMAYLRANGFKTYIVSGGGVEFMRPWAEKVYGVPREQIIGSSVKTKFEMQNGSPVLMRLPEIDFVDDGAGKPVGIQKFIGRRPIAAFGNSDGDQQMLEWTAAGPGKRLMVLIHHTDAIREYAYDHPSPVGALDKALLEAKAKSWVVVDMKKEWKRIFP